MMSTSHPDNSANVEGAMEALAIRDDSAHPSKENANAMNDRNTDVAAAYVPPYRMRNDPAPSHYSQRGNPRYNQPPYHPSQQNAYSSHRGNRYSGPNQNYPRNQGGHPNPSYSGYSNYSDPSNPPPSHAGLPPPPPHPPSSQYDRNQDYGYSHMPPPPSHEFSGGNPSSYGMSRPNPNPHWQGNRAYSNNSYYNNNSSYRNHTSGGGGAGSGSGSSSSSSSNSSGSDQFGSTASGASGGSWEPPSKSWQPIAPNYSFPPSQNGYNSRAGGSWPSSSGSYYHARLRVGYGHWDPEQGHVVAARNDGVEKALFESVHVSRGINFSKYDDIPIEASGDHALKPISSFAEANLDPLIIENIELARYETPTPVQKYSLPIVEAGRDLMACAQTGSGKTAGFLLPILNELFIRGPPSEIMPFHARNAYQRQPICPMALILAPTRELTSQIYEEAKRFAYRSWVRPVVAYGGIPVKDQWHDFKQGCGLLVATPGRLSDLLSRGMISLRHVRYLVLDEADRMLDMGFEPQIRGIVEGEDMPGTDGRVTLMFSATFPKEIQHLAGDFLSDYIFLSVGRVGAASENVHQTLIEVKEDDKKDVLLDILHSNPAGPENLVLIFVETKKMCDMIANFLRKSGFHASAIHGDRDQRERESALEAFRNAVRPILVATAVAARGLDIPNVTYVLNYDLPNDIDDYVHRIGRTGRAGNPGKSITFFNLEKNKNVIKDLYQIFKDAHQEIPAFLESYYNDVMTPYRTHMANRGSGSKRGGGRGGGAHRDFRRDADYASYQPPSRSHGYGHVNNSYYNSNNEAGNDWGGWDGRKW